MGIKAIYLGSPDKLKRVYRPETADTLFSRFGEMPTLSADELCADPARFAEVEAIFATWGMPKLTEEQIAACLPRLRAVFYGAGTVQGFARPFLARGVTVFSAWAANAVPVAEVTTAEIILATKGYYAASRIFKESGSKRAAAAFVSECPGNFRTRVGLVGLGMIGRLVAEKLRAVTELEVCAFDKFLSADRAAALGVTLLPLEELFATSQVVSNHLANNAQTQGYLRYGHFAALPKNAVFLNTGRGAQVVESDLCRALSERPDLTAVLDVTAPEPPAADSPFYTLPNVVLTPHFAGSSGNEVARMGETMLEECRRFYAGEPTRYAVTPEMLETMA